VETEIKPLRKSYILVLGLFLAIAMLMMGGVIMNPGERVVGDKELHVWDHLWHCWWMKHCVEQGVSFMHTGLLNYPQGMDVYGEMSTLLFPALTVPLQFVIGLAASYNMTVLFLLVLGAFGMYLVCLKISSRPWESFLGGLIFGFSPFFQTEISNGMVEQLGGLVLLPYLVIFLLRMNERLKPFDGIAAGAILAVSAFSSFYGLLAGGLLAVIFFFSGLFSVGTGSRKSLLIVYGVFAFSVGVLLCVPFALLLNTANAERAQSDWSSIMLGQMRSKGCIDVLRFICLPPYREPPLVVIGAGRIIPFGVYLGKVVIISCLLAAVFRVKEWRIWKWGLLLSLLLTMGLYLNVHAQTQWWGMRVPLLNRAIVEIVPKLSRPFALHNYRFVAVVLVFAGILTTLVISRGLDRLKCGNTARRIFISICCITVLTEFTLSQTRNEGLRLPSVSVEIPAVYNTLKESEPGPIFNLPVGADPFWQVRINGTYMYLQTYHHQPIHASMGIAPIQSRVFYLIATEEHKIWGTPWYVSDLQLQDDCRNLWKRGFRYIIVHWKFFNTSTRAVVRKALDRRLSVVVDEPGTITVYKLSLLGNTMPESLWKSLNTTGFPYNDNAE